MHHTADLYKCMQLDISLGSILFQVPVDKIFTSGFIETVAQSVEAGDNQTNLHLSILSIIVI